MIQKRKRASCFEMGRGYWEALPQARPPGLCRAGLGQQAPRGSQPQTHACPCVILQPPAPTPAQLWRCSLLVTVTVTVDAFLVLRPAQDAPVRGLQRLPLRLAGQLSSEGRRSASCRYLSCYFVALELSGQAAPPNTSVPWETPFQQKKREKEKEVP